MKNEPEWTAENQNRKKGDTTFKQCGWCEHASCGSVRYNCYLETRCSLMRSYGVGHEMNWDSECVVNKLGKKDMESVIRSKQYDIKNAEVSIKRIKDEVKTIKGLSLKEKPPIPDLRGQEFVIGEVLYVFHDNKWNRGICVSGYRSGDGCVSYVLDAYPDSKKGWGCGTGVPCVLKEWEFKYFQNNLEDFKVWLDLSDRKYNGDRLDLKAYYDAMTQAAYEAVVKSNKGE